MFRGYSDLYKLFQEYELIFKVINYVVSSCPDKTIHRSKATTVIVAMYVNYVCTDRKTCL